MNIKVATIAGKGRSVVAIKKIRKGQLIAESEPIIIPARQYKHFSKTVLNNYCFEWEKGCVALSMDITSFLNHSYDANAYYEGDAKDQKIRIFALRTIKKNEEVTINYNGDGDTSPVGFRVK